MELRLPYTLIYSALTVTLQLKSNQRIAGEKKRASGLVTSDRKVGSYGPFVLLQIHRFHNDP